MCKKHVIFDHTSHTRLWQWLAQNPGKNKKDALAALGMSIPAGYNKEYACAYAAKRGRSALCYCDYCPLIVPDDVIKQLQLPHEIKELMSYGGCLRGLYAAWAESRDCYPNVASAVAEIIAALPARAGVQTK